MSQIILSRLLLLMMLFKQNGTGYKLQEILSNDIAAGDMFGRAVAISGNLAVIGAHFDAHNETVSGLAYVFERNAPTDRWVQTHKLVPMDGNTGDKFGLSVAIYGHYILIGAPNDGDNGQGSG
eukprot:161760_1